MTVWSLIYEDFNRKQEKLREALCTLGNGCFATRGASPESRADERTTLREKNEVVILTHSENLSSLRERWDPGNGNR